jgi:hypothetical protein
VTNRIYGADLVRLGQQRVAEFRQDYVGGMRERLFGKPADPSALHQEVELFHKVRGDYVPFTGLVSKGEQGRRPDLLDLTERRAPKVFEIGTQLPSPSELERKEGQFSRWQEALDEAKELVSAGGDGRVYAQLKGGKMVNVTKAEYFGPPDVSHLRGGPGPMPAPASPIPPAAAKPPMPRFGAPSSTPVPRFGAPSSTPVPRFGAPSSTPTLTGPLASPPLSRPGSWRPSIPSLRQLGRMGRPIGRLGAQGVRGGLPMLLQNFVIQKTGDFFDAATRGNLALREQNADVWHFSPEDQLQLLNQRRDQRQQPEREAVERWLDVEAKRQGLTRKQVERTWNQQWIDQQKRAYGPNWRNVGPRMSPAPARSQGLPWMGPEFWQPRQRQPRTLPGFPARPLAPIAMRRPIAPLSQSFLPATISRPFPPQPPPSLDSLRRLREQSQSSARRTQQMTQLGFDNLRRLREQTQRMSQPGFGGTTQQGFDNLRRLREQTQRMSQPAFGGPGRVGIPPLGGPPGVPAAYRAPMVSPIPPATNLQPIGAYSRPGLPTIGPPPSVSELGGLSRSNLPSNTLTPGQSLVRWSDPGKLAGSPLMTIEIHSHGPGYVRYGDGPRFMLPGTWRP